MTKQILCQVNKARLFHVTEKLQTSAKRRLILMITDGDPDIEHRPGYWIW